MKKIFLSCFSAIFFSGAPICVTYTQHLSYAPITAQPVRSQKYSSASPSDIPGHRKSLYRNEVPSRALRNFVNQYKNIEDEKWFRLKDGTDGFVVFFKKDGVKTDISYHYCPTKIEIKSGSEEPPIS